MGMILYTQKTEKGTLNFIAGTVEKIIEPSDKKRPHTLVINAKVYDGKKWVSRAIHCNSWSDSKHNQIERIKTLKLTEGAFVFVTTGSLQEYQNVRQKTSVLQAPLFSISYTTLRSIYDTDYRILVGTVLDIEENDNGATVNVGLNLYDANTKTVYKKNFACNIPSAVYSSLKKEGLAKWGNLAMVGFCDDEEATFDVKRATFNPRIFEDQKD